jgi:hypothetical protein
MTRRTLFRAVQVIAALALVALVVRDLIRGWREVLAAPPAWRIDPALLVLATILTWGAYLALIWAWRALLAGWGRPLRLLPAARVWALASLGRYIPGKVWTIAGAAVLAQPLGVPPWMSTSAAVLLQLLAIGSGVVAVGLTGAGLFESMDPGLRVGTLVVGLLAGGGTVAVALPGLFRRVVRWIPGMRDAEPAPAGPVIAAAVVNLATWFAYGASFWLVAHGVLADPVLGLPTAVAAYTMSYLAGFLAAFAPGGIGVRESIIILLLRGSIGLGPAAALAVASRFFITVVELGFVLPFLFLKSKNGPAARATETTDPGRGPA